MKKFSYPVLIILLLTVIAITQGFYVNHKIKETERDIEYQRAFINSNKVCSLVLPKEVTFAGEKAPLNLYYVREGLERELTINTYLHASNLLILKRTGRFFDIIIPILNKNNIPEDFKYMVLAESGLIHSRSGAGAAGFWQIMPETGKEAGLEITDEVDERYHIEKATEAACRIIKGFYNKYGSWTLVAAAYNGGGGRLSRTMDEQKVNNFFDLYLPEETMRYIFRIYAYKLIYENPTTYGYFIRNKDIYQPLPVYQIPVNTTIESLVDFAKENGITYRLLKEYNPWLRKDKLTVANGKTYDITLPQKGFENIENIYRPVTNPERIFKDTINSRNLLK